MKKEIFVFIFLIFNSIENNAQVVFDLPDSEKKKNESHVLISFHAALGFINPSDVNNYIQTKVNNITQGNTIFYQGSPSISVAGSLNLSIVYRFKNHFQLSAPIEYAGAPKTITINKTTLNFNLQRFSIGAMGDYLLPLENENALNLSAGLLYHMISFEGYKVNIAKPRFEFGYTSFKQRYDWEIFFQFDLAGGSTNQSNINSITKLDFSGVYLGWRIILS
jgi:hypothetical protein